MTRLTPLLRFRLRLRPLRPTLASLSRTGTRSYTSTFQSQPSPPRLPAEQQAEFERLQRAAAERLGLLDPQQQQQQPDPPLSTSRHVTTPSPDSSASSLRSKDQTQAKTPDANANAQAEVTVDASDPLAPVDGVWRGAPPEFEGDVNPRTGEVGGPKNEPLRWGGKGDWSYNGRVTDF